MLRVLCGGNRLAACTAIDSLGIDGAFLRFHFPLALAGRGQAEGNEVAPSDGQQGAGRQRFFLGCREEYGCEICRSEKNGVYIPRSLRRSQ